MDEIDALVNDLPDEVVDFIQSQHEEIQDLRKRLDAITPDEEPEEMTFEKALSALPDEVAQTILADRERLAKAEAELAAEREAKADAEYIEKVRHLDGVGEPEVFGPALRRIAEALPSDAELVEKALAALTEQTRMSDIFKEFGHSAAAPAGSVEERIEAIAKSYQAEDPDLTDEVARAKAWEENPDLYEAHTAERRRR